MSGKIIISWRQNRQRGLMATRVRVAELRKRLGVKKLKAKIPLSASEKAEIRQLREHDRRRVTHAEKLKA